LKKGLSSNNISTHSIIDCVINNRDMAQRNVHFTLNEEFDYKIKFGNNLHQSSYFPLFTIDNKEVFVIGNHTFLKYNFEFNRDGKVIAELKETSILNFKRRYYLTSKESAIENEELFIDKRDLTKIKSSFFSVACSSSNSYKIKASKGFEIHAIFVVAVAILMNSVCSKLSASNSDSW